MDTSTFFDDYYTNAVLNCILIMDENGIILDTNQAFSKNFGYINNELNGQNFRILFSLKDRDLQKPEHELENILNKGHALDENYILNKDGKEIWVTGEAMLAVAKTGKNYIIKDVVNLQSKKQLELFHIETEELMERVFDGNNETSVIVLDGGGKILKVNLPFLKLFEIEETPNPGSSLSQLNHHFLSNPDLKSEIRKILVENKSIIKGFTYETSKGEILQLKLIAKVIGWQERKVYIIIEEIKN